MKHNSPRSGSDSAKTVIEQIWHRGRINAWAHRAAKLEASRRAVKYFVTEMIAGFGAILWIILVYVFATSPEAKKIIAPSIDPAWMSLTFTVLSIVFTLISLFTSVMAHALKLDVLAARHDHLLNSYQSICQRAREVKWPDRPAEDVVALLKDLERDFHLLKATGAEPTDGHFDIAHSIARKIQGDKNIRVAQSFGMGEADDEAQHIGEDDP